MDNIMWIKIPGKEDFYLLFLVKTRFDFKKCQDITHVRPQLGFRRTWVNFGQPLASNLKLFNSELVELLGKKEDYLLPITGNKMAIQNHFSPQLNWTELPPVLSWQPCNLLPEL